MTSCEELHRVIVQNDLNKLKHIENLEQLVNVKYNGKTSLEVAAGDSVNLQIWEWLIPFAELSEYSDFSGVLETLIKKINDPNELSKTFTVIPIHQIRLLKMKCWLEMSNNYTENLKKVEELKLFFLCILSTVQPSGNPYATATDIFRLVNELIDTYEVDINGVEMTFNLCPLHWAVLTLNKVLLKRFIEKGANVNCFSSENGTPIHSIFLIRSHLNNNKDIIDILGKLLGSGVDLTLERKQYGLTALHSIGIYLDRKNLDCFLQQNMRFIPENAIESKPFPFVHGLIIHTVKSVRQYGGEEEAEKKKKQLQEDIIAKLDILTKYKFDLDVKDINNMTILHYACWFKYSDVVMHLLKTKTERSCSVDRFGRNCLYYACTFPNSEQNEFLRYDDVNATLDCVLKYFKKEDVEKCFEDHLDLESLDSSILDRFKGEIQRPTQKQKYDVREVKDRMELFAYKLQDSLRITIFDCEVVLSGSVIEGTKVDQPDEFDFQFKLWKISKYMALNRFLSPDADEVEVGFQEELDDDGRNIHRSLHSGQPWNKALFTSFNNEVYKELKKSTFWEQLPFQWRTCYHIGSSQPNTLVAPLRLKLIGNELYEDLDVDVDLVPVIVFDYLPTGMAKEIPTEVQSFARNQQFKWDIIVRKNDNARLSFSSIEKWLMLRVSDIERDSYIMTKLLLRHVTDEDHTCREMITSYMLKNALFYTLDPGVSYNLFCSLIDKMPSKIPRILPTVSSVLHGTRDINELNKLTMQVLNTLIKMFESKHCVNVYCRPNVTFPDVAFFDDEDPYAAVLKKCMIQLDIKIKDHQV